MKKTLIGIMVHNPKPLTAYEAAKDLNVDLLVFQPRGIKWSKKKIRGLLFRNGVWKWKTCSYPKAVYNRCYLSNKRIFYKLERAIGKGKVFNCKTLFDKWEIHNILHNSVARHHVPETYLYSASSLLSLIRKYDKLILKPSKGQLGRGVYLVERINNHDYRLYSNFYPQKNNKSEQESKKEVNGLIERIFDLSQKSSTAKTLLSSLVAPFKKEFLNLNTEPSNEQDVKNELLDSINSDRFYAKIYSTDEQDFVKEVNKLLFNKRYLIQQFISLDRIDQKIYDVRMYVQKDSRGQWTTSEGFSRVGRADSYLTNYASELKRIDDIQKENNLLSTTKLKSIENISIQAAKAIERKLGHLGEMSVDFGLDHEGKPWIIEVNGRTQKKLVLSIKDEQLIRTIYLKPIGYALYLAKLPPRK
jgi:hypothetical protein